MAAKKRRKAKKQSGDKASSLAGMLLRKFGRRGHGFVASDFAYITIGELRTLCASVLSQDETKGPNK